MSRKQLSPLKKVRRQPPATTPEGREQQIIGLAMDAIEQRILEGRASAQELVYFAKLGSPTARLERSVLEKQEELLKAKTESIKSQKHVEELYREAMLAMKTYSGSLSRQDE